MSLDNIQLPAGVLAELYTKPLYDLKSAESSAIKSAKGDITYLGNNNAKVSIIVNAPDTIYLPDDELNFLLGILNACQLSMADIALVNFAKYKQLSYAAVAAELSAEKIILFGVKADELELPLQFPNYQIQKFNNQVYLSAANLQELQKKVDEKKKLWACLKKIFIND